LAVFIWFDFVILSILLLVVALRHSDLAEDVPWLLVLSWVFVLVTFWVFLSWKLWVGSVFMPFSIFLMAAIAFNGGQIILEAVNLNRNGLVPIGSFPPSLLEETVLYVTLGILAFHGGGVLASRSVREPKDLVGVMTSDASMLHAMQLVGSALLLLSLPFWIYTQITQLRISLGGSYGDLYLQDYSVGVGSLPSIAASYVIPGLMMFVVGFQGLRAATIVAFLIILVMTVSDLLLGYRAFAAWPLLSFLWVVHTVVVKLPRWMLIVGSATLLFVVFPVVRVARQMTGSERVSLQSLRGLYVGIDNPIVSTVSEMGGSMATVAYTLQLIPDQKDFDRGFGYLYAFTTLVPNIFGTGVHPAIAHGTPSNWLIWEVDRWTAERGGGLGYSFIAEAYYNFGWFLGLIALLIIGASIGKLLFWLQHSWGYLGVAAAGTALAFFSLYARGEIYTIVRPIAWCVAIPVLAVLVVARSIQRRI
jgi:oligosaccharide repeat unit polymerase